MTNESLKKPLKVKFAKDDKSIFTSALDTVIKRWDTSTVSKFIREYTGHKNFVNAFNISPDGKLLVTGGQKEIVSFMGS